MIDLWWVLLVQGAEQGRVGEVQTSPITPAAVESFARSMVKKAASNQPTKRPSPPPPPRRPFPRGKPRPPSPPQPPPSMPEDSPYPRRNRGLPEHGSSELRRSLTKKAADTPPSPPRQHHHDHVGFTDGDNHGNGDLHEGFESEGDWFASSDLVEGHSAAVLHPSPRQINWSGPQGQRWLRDDPFSVLKRNQRAYVARARSVLQRMPASHRASVLGTGGILASSSRVFPRRTRQQEIHKERWDRFQERRREERLKELLGGHSDAAEKLMWEEAHAERPEWVSQRGGIEHELVVWDTYSRVPTRLLERYIPAEEWARGDDASRSESFRAHSPDSSSRRRRQRRGGGHIVHTVHRYEGESTESESPQSRGKPPESHVPPSLHSPPSRRHRGPGDVRFREEDGGRDRETKSDRPGSSQEKTLKRGVSQFVAPQYVANVRGARRVEAETHPSTRSDTSSQPRTPERAAPRRDRRHEGGSTPEEPSFATSHWEGDAMSLRAAQEAHGLPSPTEGIAPAPCRKRKSSSPGNRHGDVSDAQTTSVR